MFSLDFDPSHKYDDDIDLHLSFTLLWLFSSASDRHLWLMCNGFVQFQ